MKKLIPNIHFIQSIINSDLKWVPALSEFVDNSYDAGKAHMLSFTFEQDSITIEDDGIGVHDINALFRLGESRSRFDKGNIGLYGVGAKQAALWIGSDVTVETVHDGVLHKHRVNWQGINDWPEQYDGKGQKTRRHSGTKIVIRNLHEGRQSAHMDAIANGLGSIFAPALRSGRVMKLVNARKKNHVTYDVQPDEPPVLHDTLQFEGVIRKAPYKAFIGCQDKYENRHNKLFVSFGHRVIVAYDNPWRDRKAMPNLFYGRVELGEEWKPRLSTNKTAIVKYEQELLDAIYESCSDLLKKYSAFEDELQVEIVNIDLGNAVGKALRVAEGKGTYGPQLVQRMESNSETQKDGDKESADAHPRLPFAEEGNGKLSIDEFKGKNAINVSVHKVPLGEYVPSRVREEQGCFIVELNSDLHHIRDAYDVPFNVSTLAGVVCFSLAIYLVKENHRLCMTSSDLPAHEREVIEAGRLLKNIPRNLQAKKLKDIA